MKNPRTIKAYAAVSKEKPKINTNDIFRDSDITMDKSERKCIVEIKFIKYIK